MTVNINITFAADNGDSTEISVKKTTDFKVDGEGRSPNWDLTPWRNLPVQETAGPTYSTKAKVLYSDLGVYFLFACEDRKITATIQEDFGSLFKEDVVEVFLWPDTSVPIYFEYELSPLNYELPILVPNINGKFNGWKALHYEGKQRIRHATSVQGGERKSNSIATAWTAEVFIPYALLNPIVQLPPRSGTRWRANMYRIDYDKGYTSWSWQKTTPKVRGSFHQFNKFGTLVFE